MILTLEQLSDCACAEGTLGREGGHRETSAEASAVTGVRDAAGSLGWPGSKISDKDGLTVRVGGRADLLKIWLSDNPVGRVANLGDGEQWNNWKFYTLGNMPCIVK